MPKKKGESHSEATKKSLAKARQKRQKNSAIRRKITKRKLIKLLREGYTVKRACSICNISNITFYRWKSDDDDFAQEVEGIMYDPVYETKRKYKLASGDNEPDEDDWREKFYFAYADTGLKSKAADAAGVSALLVEKMLDEDSERYDEEFATMLNEVELRRLWDIEDNEMAKSLQDSKSAHFILSSRMREKYGKSPFGSGDQNQLVQNFWFSRGGESEAVKIMNKMFGEDREVKQIES